MRMSININMATVASPISADLAAPKARTLAQAPVGTEATIAEICEPGALGERLLEMGLVPGTRLSVVRRGFFGSPVQLWVRGYMLSLRKSQAEAIRIEAQG